MGKCRISDFLSEESENLLELKYDSKKLNQDLRKRVLEALRASKNEDNDSLNEAIEDLRSLKVKIPEQAGLILAYIDLIDSMRSKSKQTIVKKHTVNKSSSNFIPVFDSSSNIKIFKEVLNALFTCSFKFGLGYVTSRELFNSSIYGYKNKLFKLIQAYLLSIGLVNVIQNLYENGIAQQIIYKTVMEAMSGTITGDETISHYSASDIKHLAIIAYYILNNFDDVVEITNNDIILIDPKYKGTNDFVIKYSHKLDKAKRQDFLESLATHNADGETSNKIFKKWINTIKSEKSGEMMTDADLSYIYKELHKYMIRLEEELLHLQTKYNKLRDDTTDYAKELAQEIGDLKVFNTYINKLLNTSLDYKERIQALIDGYHRFPSILLKVAPNIAALVKALESEFQTVKKTLNNPRLNHKQKQFLESTLNMPALFISNIDLHRIFAANAVDATSRSSEIISAANFLQSKNQIYEMILAKLAENVINGNRLPYMASTYITNAIWVGNIKTVWNHEVRNFLERNFGLVFTNEQAYEISKNAELLRNLNACISSLSMYAKDLIDKGITSYAEAYEFLKASYQGELARTGHWMGLSGFLIKENVMSPIKLKDFEGNLLPNFTNENMSNSLEDSILRVKTATAFQKNILIEHGNRIFSTIKEEGDFKSKVNWTIPESTRLSVKISEDKYGNVKTITGQNLTVVELIDIMFNEDFFTGIIKDGVFTCQLNCNSDKKTIPLIHANVMARLNDSYNLAQMSMYLIKKLYKEQLTVYFKELQNEIIQAWAEHARHYSPGRSINSINDVLNYTKSLRDSMRMLSKEQKELKLHEILEVFYKNNINNCEEFTYCISDNLIYLNTELLYYFKDANNDTASILDSSFLDYTAGLNAYQPKLNIGINVENPRLEFKTKKNDAGQFDFTEEDRKEIKKSLGLNGTNFDALMTPLRNMGIFAGKDILDTLIDCYLYTVDPNTKELILRNSTTHIPNLKDLTINLYYSKNIDTSDERKQRVLTLLNYLIEKLYYLSALLSDAAIQLESKYSMMHTSKKALYKFEGVTLEDLPSTGSELFQLVQKEIHERYKTSTKRNNSNVATSIKLVKGYKYGVPNKVRVAAIEDYTQVLHNPIGDSTKHNVVDGAAWTNGIYAILENRSFPNKGISGSKKFIGFHKDVGTLSQIKYADYEINNALLRMASNDSRNGVNMLNMFKKMNSTVIKTAFIQRHLELHLNLEALFILQGNEIYRIFIEGNQLVYKDLDNGETKFKVDLSTEYSIYDLWNLLGGAWSMSQNEEGDIDYSNASMEIIADMLCEHDSSSSDQLRELIVGKILPKLVLKSGFKNHNPKTSWEDDSPLLTFDIDSASFGLQNDSTHAADGGSTANPTLAITNISFNGKELGLTTEAHTALAEIIRLGMIESAKEMGILKILEGKDAGDTKIYEHMTKKLLASLLEGVSISAATTLLESIIAGKFPDAKIPLSGREFVYKIISDLLSTMNSRAIKSRMNGGALVYNPSLNVVTVWEDANGKPMTKKDILRKGLKEGYSGTADLIIKLYLKDKLTPIKVNNITEVNIGDKILINNTVYDLCQPLSTTPEEKIEGKYGFEDLVLDLNNGVEVTKVRHLGRDLLPFKYTWQDALGYHNIWSEPVIFNVIRAKQLLDKTKKSDNNYTTIEQNYLLAVLQVRLLLKQLKDGTDIFEFKFKAGELIIPKINKTALELKTTSTLYEIMEEGAEYFEKILRAKKFPTSLGQEIIEKIDPKSNEVYILNKDTEVYISNNGTGTNSPTLIDGQYYIQEGETTIQVAANVTYSIDYSDVKPIITIYTDSPTYILNNNDLSDSTVFHYNKLPKLIKTNKVYIKGWEDNLEAAIKKEAQKLFTSFELSNQSESLRIPTQSYQSFMAMETVAFMEGDTNDCYTNVWQSWFLGSDFDIDKNYTLLYNLNKNGAIATTTPFTSYQSKELLEASLDLPLPNVKLAEGIVSGDWTEKLKTTLYPTIYNLLPDIGADEYIEEKWEEVLSNNPELAPILYMELDKLLRSKPEVLPGSLYELYITHNLYKPNKKGYLNKLVRNIFKASSSIINMEYSVLPMSADPTREAYNEILEEEGLSEDSFFYSHYNPLAKFTMLELNAVGKVQVGIYANGIKVVGTLLEYFNKYYKNLNEGEYSDPNKSFYVPKMQFNYKTEKGEDKLINIGPYITFGNCNIELLYTDLSTIIDSKFSEEEKEKIKEMLFKLQENIADKLSIMISLATDNAKELLLGNINSTPETANLFVALYSLGVPTKDIIRLSVNILGPIVNKFKSNNRLRNKKDFTRDLLEAIKKSELDDETKENLKSLYYYGLELTGLASFFGINLGISARWAEMENILDKLNRVLDRLKSQIKLADLVGKVSYKKVLLEGETQTVVGEGEMPINNSDLYPILLLPLDILLFTSNNPWIKVGDLLINYKELMITYFNNGKLVINVLDVIASTPHFFEMYKALCGTMDTTRLIMSRVGFIEFLNQNPLTKNWEKIKPSQLIVMTTDEENHNEEEKSAYSRLAKLSEEIDVFDHYIIGECLKQLPKYTFLAKDLKRKLKVEYDLELDILDSYPSNYLIKLDTKEGIDIFMLMMEGIIPKLQLKYNTNGFFKELIRKLGGYDLLFSFFEADDSTTAELRAINIEEGYNQIKDLNSQISNEIGEPIVLGELFYLYNMIAHKNKIGRLNKFVNMMSESYGNPLHAVYLKTINDIDTRYINRMKELREKKKKDASFNIWDESNWSDFPFSLLRNITKTINDTDKERLDTVTKKMYDLSDNYIYTITSISENYADKTIKDLKAEYKVEGPFENNEYKVIVGGVSYSIYTDDYGKIKSEDFFKLKAGINEKQLNIEKLLHNIYGKGVKKGSVSAIESQLNANTLLEPLFELIFKDMKDMDIYIVESNDIIFQMTDIDAPILIISSGYINSLTNKANSTNIGTINNFLNLLTSYGELENKLNYIKFLDEGVYNQVKKALQAYLDNKAYVTNAYINLETKLIYLKYHKKVTTERNIYYSSRPVQIPLYQILKYDIIKYTLGKTQLEGLYLGKLNGVHLVYNISSLNIEELLVEKNSQVEIYTPIAQIDTILKKDISHYKYAWDEDPITYNTGDYTKLTIGDKLKIGNEEFYITDIFIDGDIRRFILQNRSGEVLLQTSEKLDKITEPITYLHTSNFLFGDLNLKTLATIDYNDRLPNRDVILNNLYVGDKIIYEEDGVEKEGYLTLTHPRGVMLILEAASKEIKSVPLSNIKQITLLSFGDRKFKVTKEFDFNNTSLTSPDNNVINLMNNDLLHYIIPRLHKNDLLIINGTTYNLIGRNLTESDNNLYLLDINTLNIIRMSLNDLFNNSRVSIITQDYDLASAYSNRAYNYIKPNSTTIENEFLTKLSKAFGNIPIKFVSREEAEQIMPNSKGWTDGLSIFLVDDISDLKETAIHELLHIIFSYIRINNPELYYQWIKEKQKATPFTALLDFIDSEEYIVEDIIKKLRINSTTDLSIVNAIISNIQLIFNIPSSNDFNFSQNISSLITLSTRSKIGALNITKLKSILWLNWMNDIDYKCK